MSNEIDDIISPELQTLEDLISGEFCECSHLINEHYVGDITKTTKCFAFIFNGIVWSSCRCSELRIKEFKISFVVEDHAENISNAIAA